MKRRATVQMLRTSALLTKNRERNDETLFWKHTDDTHSTDNPGTSWLCWIFGIQQSQHSILGPQTRIFAGVLACHLLSGRSTRRTGKNIPHTISLVRQAASNAGSARRNHCPNCLSSLHVDFEPGDRASDCSSIMEPAAVRVCKGGKLAIIHRCRRNR